MSQLVLLNVGLSMLSVREVAERLGMSRSLVYREIRQGRLAHHRFANNTIRVSEDDLKAYIAAHRVETSTHNRLPLQEQGRHVNAAAFKHLDVSRLLSQRNGRGVL